MWKPIRKAINKLYYKYGDKPQPIKPYKIIIDKTELNHYKVCKRYNYLEYTHICDDPYFEEHIKDSLIDKLADAIKVTKKMDVYSNGDIMYEAEIWVKE